LNPPARILVVEGWDVNDGEEVKEVFKIMGSLERLGDGPKGRIKYVRIYIHKN
jgi:hypothetical protein